MSMLRVLVLLGALGAIGCKSGDGDVPADGAPPADGLDAAAPPAGDLGPTPARELGANVPDRGPGAPIEGKWIAVKPGGFTMGSPPDEPCRDGDEAAHPVTLTRGFLLAETEVTQRQWASLMGYQPAFNAGCAECPVEWVSWHEAAAYCNALSTAKGKPLCYACAGSGAGASCAPQGGPPSACAGYRLPTEAEWEHAARAGSTSALPSGAIASCMTTDAATDKIAWYKVNSGGLTHAVAKKSPNAWGLFDMAGNVYEWTHDWYAADLGAAAVVDPAGPASGKERVFRGGAFYFNAEHARSANRERFDPAKRFTFVGFRCALSQ
jgi:formylglycine-generating enzyme required for sulfatase activity